MAATEEGELLTRAYLQSQVRLRRLLVAELARLWPIIRVEDLGASSARWLAAVQLLLTRRFGVSVGLAPAYLKRFSAAETGTASVVTAAGGPPVEQLKTSLRVTGPVTITRSLAAGTSSDAALANGFVTHSGAAARLVLAGGRQTLATSIERDRRALGYARVTAHAPCAFCAMLASRGPIYKSAHDATFRRDGRRYHDHCVCFAEPVYRRDAAWPGRARDFHQLWKESTADVSGQEAINAFRRAYSAAPIAASSAAA